MLHKGARRRIFNRMITWGSLSIYMIRLIMLDSSGASIMSLLAGKITFILLLVIDLEDSLKLHNRRGHNVVSRVQ